MCLCVCVRGGVLSARVFQAPVTVSLGAAVKASSKPKPLLFLVKRK